MSPLIHFTLSSVAALAMSQHFNKRYLVVLLLGVMGAAPDLDHLLSYSHEGIHVSVLHNIYILTFLPLCLLFASFFFENLRGGESSVFQRVFLALTIILTGHLVIDILAGNTMALHFPFSINTFAIKEGVLVDSGVYGGLLDPSELIFGSWLLAIIVGHFAHRRLFAISEEFRMETIGLSRPYDQYIISKNIRKPHPDNL